MPSVVLPGAFVGGAGALPVDHLVRLPAAEPLEVPAVPTGLPVVVRPGVPVLAPVDMRPGSEWCSIGGGRRRFGSCRHHDDASSCGQGSVVMPAAGCLWR